jgi:hypothetical protein
MDRVSCFLPLASVFYTVYFFYNFVCGLVHVCENKSFSFLAAAVARVALPPGAPTFTQEEKNSLLALPGWWQQPMYHNLLTDLHVLSEICHKLHTEVHEAKLLVAELSDEVKTLRATQPSDGTQFTCVEEIKQFDDIEEFEAFCLTLLQPEPLKIIVSILLFYYGSTCIHHVYTTVFAFTICPLALASELSLQQVKIPNHLSCRASEF